MSIEPEEPTEQAPEIARATPDDGVAAGVSADDGPAADTAKGADAPSDMGAGGDAEADRGLAPDAEPAPDPEPTPEPAWDAEQAQLSADPAAAPAAQERPQSCAAGLFGKLPARGDFIARNLSRALMRPLEDWLMATLRETRESLGGGWETAWYSAPAWRFWLGGAVLGGEWQRAFLDRGQGRPGAVTGVLLPSADRAGRHFPLMVVLADERAGVMPPPVVAAPDDGWYAACDQLLYDARQSTELEPVEAALAGLPGPILPDWASERAPLLNQRSLWAQGTAVWDDVSAVDHHIAAQNRSYWWAETGKGDDAQTSALSLPGLPDAATLAFMLSIAQGQQGSRG